LVVTSDDRIEYARIVWQAWCDRRGQTERDIAFMTPAEWFQITRWMDAEVPLRIVLRGMQDCAGKIGPRTQIMYIASSVEEAHQHWARAVGA
jgi:hypothetical protein